MKPRRPETAKTLRSVTGKKYDACENSLRNFASAPRMGKAYSMEALVKKPRCGSTTSSRRSQKNVGVMLEILTLVRLRLMPGKIAESAFSQNVPLLHLEILYS